MLDRLKDFGLWFYCCALALRRKGNTILFKFGFLTIFQLNQQYNTDKVFILLAPGIYQRVSIPGLSIKKKEKEKKLNWFGVLSKHEHYFLT